MYHLFCVKNVSMNKQMSSLSPLPLEGGVSVAVSGGRRRSRRHRYGVGGEEPAVEVAVAPAAPAVAGQMEGARRRRSRKAGQEGARRRRSHKAGQEEMTAGRRRRHRKAGQSMKAGQEGARRRHSRKH